MKNTKEQLRQWRNDAVSNYCTPELVIKEIKKKRVLKTSLCIFAGIFVVQSGGVPAVTFPWCHSMK